MKIVIYILILLLVALSCQGEGVQEKIVMGFKSGLMNSISNDLMPDDAAVISINYDYTEYGYLERRKGFQHHFLDDWTGNKIDHLISFHSSDGEDILFVTRVGSDYFGNDTLNYNLCVLTQCDSTLMGNAGACTTVVYAGVAFHYRNPELPYHLNSVMMNDRMTIVATNTGMFNYNGSDFYESAPKAPGEAWVELLTNGGVSGDNIKYKYCYTDYLAPNLVDTSNLSCPTKAVTADANKIAVWGWATPVEVYPESVLIFRSIDGGKYEEVGHVPITSAFLDNVTTTNPADTLDYEWGVFPRAEALSGDRHDSVGSRNYYPPPGGLNTTLYGSISVPGILGGAEPISIDSQSVVGYMVYYFDSAGNKSQLSAMTEIEQRIIFDPTGLDTIYALGVAVPESDNKFIKGKVLLRYTWPYATGLAAKDSMYRRIYILDTLMYGVTSVWDAYRFVDISQDQFLYCNDIPMDTLGYLGVMPESTCHDTYYSIIIDSLVYFNAYDITFHGFRAYAIGDRVKRNHLYFSDFGNAEIWPYDKYILIPSQFKDWLVRMVNIGDFLYLFRQYSILALSGLSFYQYQLKQINQGIGLLSPWSLAIDNNIMYFNSVGGMYAMSPSGDISKLPISLPVKNAFDSVNNYNLPWSKIINGELWASLPTTNDTANNVTYIYSPNPREHWKTYDIGIKDGALHDYQSPNYNYNTTRWIFAMDNDTLWRWNYMPESDTLDDTARIVATFQSKFFFEGDDREKIMYLDLIGSGVCDSMMITFYENYGDSINGRIEIPIDSQLVAMDWYSGEKQRITVDHIVNNFSFKIRDYGYGQYKLRGFVIGYIPWDGGKVRP